MSKEKVLWVVNYDKLDTFIAQAKAANATAVAIRTDNDLGTAIPMCHKNGLKVYGWRWPSARRDAAMNEARKVVALFGKGLDGYYVDPEGDKGQPWDWDQPGLDALAKDFCAAITAASNGKPFGVTSHYRAASVFPHLPWQAFFSAATVMLPQAYWRCKDGLIGHGPQDNYAKSLSDWKLAGAAANQSIVPMAGELAYATASEIDTYAAMCAAHDADMHFYAAEGAIATAVWDAVARATV